MTNVVDLNVNRAVDASGNYLAGAKAYFYQSGTSTPVTVYTDAAATTPHATPVVADGSGVFPAIYAAGSVALKVNVTTSSGAAVPGYPRDPVVIFSDSSTGASSISFSPITGNGALNVQAAIANIQPVVNDVSTVARTVTSKTTLALMRSTLAVGDNFNNSATLITDWNVTASGVHYALSTATNAPGAFIAVGFTSYVDANSAGQIAIRVGGDEIYYRRKGSGTWQSWVRVIDTANLAANLNASGSAPIYAPRAWVTFNASTGTPTILASGNVSSITDNGVGDFKINFTTAMADANFAVCGASSEGVAGSHTGWDVTARLAGSVTITVGVGTTEYDTDYVSVIVLR